MSKEKNNEVEIDEDYGWFPKLIVEYVITG